MNRYLLKSFRSQAFEFCYLCSQLTERGPALSGDSAGQHGDGRGPEGEEAVRPQGAGRELRR